MEQQANHLGAEMLEQIAFAASDYRMATMNEGFANEFGGLDYLRSKLFSLVDQWENRPDNLYDE